MHSTEKMQLLRITSNTKLLSYVKCNSDILYTKAFTFLPTFTSVEDGTQRNVSFAPRVSIVVP